MPKRTVIRKYDPNIGRAPETLQEASTRIALDVMRVASADAILPSRVELAVCVSNILASVTLARHRGEASRDEAARLHLMRLDDAMHGPLAAIVPLIETWAIDAIATAEVRAEARECGRAA